MIPEALSGLVASCTRSRSSVCCGVDLDYQKLPTTFEPFSSVPSRTLAFAAAIADITYPLVCCYKVQKAFLEVSEAPSPRALVDIVRQHAPGAPIILDAKLGDVDHTLHVYLTTYFGSYGFDGVVLNPYMGSGILEVMRRWPGKTGYVLVRTSNPGSDRVQKLTLRGGEELWAAVLRDVISEWQHGTAVVPILSAFDVEALTRAAKMLPPAMPVFLAGVGAQGASPNHLRAIFGSERQLIVNSSRGLTFAFECHDPLWRDRVAAAARSLRDALRVP